MRRAEVKPIPQRVMEISAFNGINDNVYIPEGCFKDMENMSSDYYPAMGQRAIRQKYSVNGQLNGVITVNRSVYMVVGTGLYKDGEKIEDVTLADSKKKLLAYGAYIVIMPDKVMFNTKDSTITGMEVGIDVPQFTGKLYLSDKEGVRYIVAPENGDFAKYITNGTSDMSVKDRQISNYIANTGEWLPGYANTFKTTYAKGTQEGEQVLNNAIILFGSKAPIISNSSSDNTSYKIGLSDISSDNRIQFKFYESQTNIWSTPDLYVTWYFKSDYADFIEKNIKTGDFIKFKTENENGNEIKKGDVEDSYWAMIEHFNGYVKVENVLRKGNEIGLVFSNTGIDFLKVLQNMNGITYGNYCLDASAGGENKYAKSVFSLITFYDFPHFKAVSGAKNIQLIKGMPDMDYMTVSNNRIWGCSSEKHEIYACKQGDATSWYCYSGIASDAYSVTIGSDCDFTGACTYRGDPYFFKEDLIICMYGNKPSNYQVSEIHYPGVEKGSSDSICYLGGVMYFKSRQGVVRFDGSSVKNVSEELGRKLFKEGIACAGDTKYFVSMKESGVYRLYVYDTLKGMWHGEDYLRPDGFFKLGGTVFGYISGSETSSIYRIDGFEELEAKGVITEKTLEIPEYVINESIKVYNRGISWYAETGPVESGSVQVKYIQRMGIRYELKERAVLTLKVAYDNDTEWTELYTHEGKKNEGAVSIAFRPRRCEKFRLRFEGEGECRIHNIQRIINEGSDMHHGKF